MTITYTIGCTFLSFALAVSIFMVFDMVEHKSKILFLPIFVAIGCILILFAVNKPKLDRYYDVNNPSSYQDLFPEAYAEGYAAGYKKALEEVLSTSSNNN